MTDKFFKSNFNAKDITKFLNEAAKKLSDLTPLMKTARVFLKKTVDENFETEGEHTGKKWKAWKEKWKKQRIKMGRDDGKILNLDGGLRRSILAKHGSDFALVGTNKKYAAIHNFGGNKSLKRNKTMPKREFMRIDETQQEYLQADLYVQLKDILIEKETNKKVFGD